MNIFKVAYMPEISEEAKMYILKKITPSMLCEDTKQYNIDICIEILDDLFPKDKLILQDLANLEVAFIEI